MRILIIDDEPLILNVIGKMIKKLGHESVGFSDELDAMEYLKDRQHETDLILLDVKLKRFSGKEIFNKIKEINPNQEIIAITGYGLNEDVQELLDSGMKSYLMKPFGFTEIKEMLCKLSI
jgi:DNA-binding response OmpR family regulator